MKRERHGERQNGTKSNAKMASQAVHFAGELTPMPTLLGLLILPQ
jgi:hypothetical protein